MMKLSTPNSVDLSMTVFIPGIRASQPSKPNRFSDVHFVDRNSSNLQDNTKSLQNAEFLVLEIPVKFSSFFFSSNYLSIKTCFAVLKKFL